VSVIYCLAGVLAGVAVDGGNGIFNGTCQEVQIALVKRQGRVAALDEEIEGSFVVISAGLKFIAVCGTCTGWFKRKLCG